MQIIGAKFYHNDESYCFPYIRVLKGPYLCIYVFYTVTIGRLGVLLGSRLYIRLGL